MNIAMAQSLSFFGNRRGSTKSHTYQVNGGQQITKDRVDEVKNPRTTAQMVHRCCLHTLSDAHAYLRPFIGGFWEGARSPQAALAAFRKANYPIVRAAAEGNDQSFSFSPFGENTTPYGLFLIANGSLKTGASGFGWSLLTGRVFELRMPVSNSTFPNIKDYFLSRDYRIGDQFNLLMVVFIQGSMKPLFMEIQVSIKSIPDALPSEVDLNDVVSYRYKVTGLSSTTSVVVDTALRLRADVGINAANLFTNLITCCRVRNVGGKRLVRPTYFVIPRNFCKFPTFTEAIATYPQGGGNVLDGGAI